MSDNPVKNQKQNDEIDLGQLFKLIGTWFQVLFRNFLVVFVYLKKNIFWLAGLVILGAIFGYVINQFSEGTQRLDVIVKPNLDTKNYLYNVIEELQADIAAKDTIFFNSLGMDIEKMEGFEIEILSLKNQITSSLDDEMKVLELLKDFESNGAISDILRSQLQDKTTRDERITFYFRNSEIGEEYAHKIIAYINSNPYYRELIKVYTENAQNRIAQNDSLIRQVDVLIKNYTTKMLKEQATSEGRLVLENQEPLNIPSLFSLKNSLIESSQAKRLELERRQEAITIVNFGKSYNTPKPLYRKKIILFPLLFLGVFFLTGFIRFLNGKSKEMKIG